MAVRSHAFSPGDAPLLLQRSQRRAQCRQAGSEVATAMPAHHAPRIDEIRFRHTDRPERPPHGTRRIARHQHARPSRRRIALDMRIVGVVDTDGEHADSAAFQCVVQRIEDGKLATTGRAPCREYGNHGGQLACADAKRHAIQRPRRIGQRRLSPRRRREQRHQGSHSQRRSTTAHQTFARYCPALRATPRPRDSAGNRSTRSSSPRTSVRQSAPSWMDRD